MSTIKKILKPIVQKAYKHKAESKLSTLREIQDKSSDKIANAIYEALKNKITTSEIEWIDKIERKRKSLNNSSEHILLTDYGAGDADDSRTESEMNKGIFIEKTVGEVCLAASKPYFWSILLFKLVKEFKPSVCIELGTCLGVSGAFQAASLKLNGKGKLITMEGAEELAAMSKNNFHELGLDIVQVIQGKFQDNLDKVLEENKPIDYAFIDGHHDEHATISYFEQFIPYLSEKSIMVFDDISWSEGMRRAWNKISEDENVKIAVDLRAIGIIVLDSNLSEKHKIQIPMY